MAARTPTDQDIADLMNASVNDVATRYKSAVRRWQECRVQVDLMKAKIASLEDQLAKKNLEASLERAKHAHLHAMVHRFIEKSFTVGALTTDTRSALLAQVKELEPASGNTHDNSQQNLLYRQDPSTGEEANVEDDHVDIQN